MVEVIWSAEARGDLRSIAEYIEKDSTQYATAVIEKLLLVSERLQYFPLSGKLVAEINMADIREIIEGNYRILYLPSAARCTVIAVAHCRQNLMKHLAKK